MRFLIETGVLATAFGVVMTLSVRAVPGNGAVWAMIWAAFFGVAGELGKTLAVAREGVAPNIKLNGPWLPTFAPRRY